ncbi:MAG: nitrogen regulation protein NR(I) [Candidimonas sp.]|nr:MAG: nitrogen regulation protein NR(I) [Candidimonas sp.]
MNSVWIADDDPSIRWVLEKALARAAVPCRCFASGGEVLAALGSDTPSVLVTDIRMPGPDGLALLDLVRARAPALVVIVMTAYTDLDSTVAAFKRGAFEYLAKPFDVGYAVSLIRRGLLEAGGDDEPPHFGVVRPTGEKTVACAPRPVKRGKRPLARSSSPAMQDIFRAIGRLAASSATVLITGESGTGKELVARALHEHSARAGGPFVAVNAAAIPRDLLEAELFGHERGAFTGATQMHRGRFEAADEGTLFLDEIGDMPLELQTRLLRVLAEGSFYRVGGATPVAVNVRVVAATHQPLEQRVAAHQFRADLFHRLNVIRLRLPPLRERRGDIPALVDLFLENSARELGVPVRRLDAPALRALTAFDYPGNIRQLENFCQWITVMSSGQAVGVDGLPPEVSDPASVEDTGVTQPVAGAASRAAERGARGATAPGSGWTSSLAADVLRRLNGGETALMAALTREFERTVFATALSHSHGRRAEAAQQLGIGRNTLARKHKALDLGNVASDADLVD